MTTVAKSLNATEIIALIPHGEEMSLLDKVTSWNNEQITCSTLSHTHSNNPLRVNNELHSCSLIEYGAQAAAIHAGLLTGSISKHNGTAFVGAIKNITWSHPLVPNNGDLIITATVEFADENGAIYRFEALHQDIMIISGRLILVQPK